MHNKKNEEKNQPTKTAAMVTVTLRDIIIGRTTPMAQEIPFMRKRAAREAMRISHLLWVIDIMAEMKKVLSINSILTIIRVLWIKPSIHPCPSRFFELYILIKTQCNIHGGGGDSNPLLSEVYQRIWPSSRDACPFRVQNPSPDAFRA